MSNKVIKPLTLAIGAAFIGAVSLSTVAQASNNFQLSQMNAGYMLGDKAPEGKCGEGKCGATKGKKCSEMADKAAQDKCMADAHKGGEKSCSGDKGKEKSCSAKGGDKSCSGDKKGGEKSCSGDKGKEKSCSHG